ncbi:hypothetical protein QR685DRAFT_572637 [Neurospora intermedia]|uniref:Uncharacterized protein n=1 Tax=Neurospora intermedia TaxID=5142 RepID=A0ABR3DD15_NEUIN
MIRPARIRRACSRSVNGRHEVVLVGRYGHGFFAKQYLRRPTSFGYGRYIHITGMPGFIFSTSLSLSSQCGRLRLSWALALPFSQRFGALVFRF